MKKTIAILLSLLILFGNVGLTIATHYCGGKAVKSGIVFGKESLGCGMESMQSSCDVSTNTAILKTKKCCSNQYTELKIDDSYKLPTSNKTLEKKVAICLQTTTFFQTAIYSEKRKQNDHNYIPPLLQRDLSVFHQTFLI